MTHLSYYYPAVALQLFIFVSKKKKNVTFLQQDFSQDRYYQEVTAIIYYRSCHRVKVPNLTNKYLNVVLNT